MKDKTEFSRDWLQASLLFFPNATHWLPRDAAEEVNQTLIDFLREQGRRSDDELSIPASK